MFRSHLFTMIVFSLIVSIMMGFLRSETRSDIARYAVKLFAYMVCGVILFAWVMRYL